MLQIPKLARGGIIDNKVPFIGEKRGKGLFDNKCIKIYKHTKNRRIKKKQIKKCPMLKTNLLIAEYILPINKLKIFVGNKEMKK